MLTVDLLTDAVHTFARLAHCVRVADTLGCAIGGFLQFGHKFCGDGQVNPSVASNATFSFPLSPSHFLLSTFSSCSPRPFSPLPRDWLDEFVEPGVALFADLPRCADLAETIGDALRRPAGDAK